MLGLKVCATTPWTHRDLSAFASQALGLKGLFATTPNYSLSLRTLSFFLFSPKPTHIFKYTVNHLEVSFIWIYLYCISLFFWSHESLICQAIWIGLKLWPWWLDPAHSLAFWDSSLMAEVPAIRRSVATTLWHFKVTASKQAATMCSQTTLKCSVGRPQQEMLRKSENHHVILTKTCTPQYWKI